MTATRPPFMTLLALVISTAVGRPLISSAAPLEQREIQSLRQAITDLTSTFGPRYPRGPEYLLRLDRIEKEPSKAPNQQRRQFDALRREALLANPLLDFGQLIVVKRKDRGGRPPGLGIGFPSNHECNASLPRLGYDNEIAVLSPVNGDGKLTTLYKPANGGYVGEVDLHWNADRLLFTQSDEQNWKLREIRPDGSGLRQVSQNPDDVDCFDPCYLPDGRIIFGSTASYQSVPCWHGLKRVSNLYLMNADGTGVRQLCFDQDHDFHPSVLDNGQVLYHRWDYTGINHIFMRQLMVMNPDGTGQHAIYGSNSWFPNALYFPRGIPGDPQRIISIISGYHGVHRMGQLVLLDTTKGWYEADGMVQRISGRGDPIRPIVRDQLVDADWPKFLHPFPLGDPKTGAGAGKYFLVSAWMAPKGLWGIYLADVFDNVVLLREEPGCALLEPVPLAARPTPPVIPDRVDLKRKDGLVYVHDIYAGPGLAGVPRGAVKRLRVLSYHFGYRGLAGPDKIGYGGPWEVMRILGTVPVDDDGSAMFRVPANTPLAVQSLDDQGKAVQLMRSWFTAMPGETVSCVGCHEKPAEAPSAAVAIAALRPAREIDPWRGPVRGFDFAREVQPVLDRYCVSCHDGKDAKAPDLRPTDQVPGYKGHLVSKMEIDRMHPKMREDTQGILPYSPAYEVLIRYIRRVNIEDDVSLLVPGEYHADTSPLVQMLRKDHGGVQLDAEACDRLITWIDLNAPCHGTWGEVYPIPDGAHARRMELRNLYGGPEDDPELVPALPAPSQTHVAPRTIPKPEPVTASNWPFNATEARRRQSQSGPTELTIDLGDGVTLRLSRIPAGEFVMGDPNGPADEQPLTRVAIPRPFWVGNCEVTNAQFHCFDPAHDCRYYTKRHARGDDQGLPLNGPNQPVVRVSWNQAMAFCQWLSQKAGRRFTLPTEAQWEYAARAGTASPLWYGTLDADFSPFANLADESFSHGLLPGGKQITGGLEHLALEGASLSDPRFNDGAVVTNDVARYRPNPGRLYDMAGNASEWTRTTYKPYPYREDDGRNDPSPEARKVVRGGSFFDPPTRARSAARLDYPTWQRIFNVGFRVACED